MIKFLEKLRTIFQNSNNHLSELVGTDELICRFLDEKNRFASTKRIVKKKAFEPDKDRHLSVYRSIGLKHEEIVNLGETYVANPKGKTLYGWGKLNAQEILNTKLKIDPDITPHKRHANLTNWPLEKHEIMDIQVELSSKAELILKEDPDS